MANIIGNNIKILRDNMGFSQSTIARFLNVDQSLISKVEKGERSLSTDMWRNLHVCSVSQLMLSKATLLKHQAFHLHSGQAICLLKIWKQSVLLTVLHLTPSIWQNY